MNYKNITSFLNNKYPEKTAEKWDTVGITFGDKKQDIKKVIVTLDITTEVIDEAIQTQVDAIITHHPFIFKDSIEEEIKVAPYKEKLQKRITNTGICIYSIHTNFDKKDMAKALVEKLGFNKFYSIPGTKYGCIVKISTSTVQMIRLLRTKLKLENITSNNLKGKTSKVAFFPGSGSIEDILLAHKAGAKMIVTSDIKWSDKLTLQHLDIITIEVSHKVEDVFVEHISKLLENKYEELKVIRKTSEELFKL